MTITINGSGPVSGLTTLSMGGALTGVTDLTMSGGLATPSVLTVGQGIKFPATQNASSDANTLDDYEEGTWTPVFEADTSAASITYTRQIGKYTKIGNVVYVEGDIAWSARSGGTGAVRVAGLPFGITGTDYYGVRIPLSYSSGTGLTSSGYALGYYTTMFGDTVLYLYPFNSNAGIGSTTITGAGGLSFKGFYYV